MIVNFGNKKKKIDLSVTWRFHSITLKNNIALHGPQKNLLKFSFEAIKVCR